MSVELCGEKLVLFRKSDGKVGSAVRTDKLLLLSPKLCVSMYAAEHHRHLQVTFATALHFGFGLQHSAAHVLLVPAQDTTGAAAQSESITPLVLQVAL